MDILNMEPKSIWKNFSSLNAIPRPSKKEGKIIAFMKQFGESLGLETSVDETGNVVIKKPATPGMEDRKPVVLQSHLDMVCQKNNDVDFDFDKDGIQTYVDGDWLKAKGTTLGADNGIGVSSIMSILQSNEIPHPQIEALFTIDEETGMTGAFGLKAGELSGKILLNLDSEEDDEITIGCAGGLDVTGIVQYIAEETSGKGIKIEIKGLQGGHSGINIHEGRGNANVLLRRFLYLGVDDNIRLIEINAGGLRNAIPREALASFLISDPDAYLKKAEELKSEILNEFKSIEKDLNISISVADLSGDAISTEDSARFIRGLKAAHNGVYRMSPDVEDLVEASNNIARVELKNGLARILNLSRSSVESTKMDVANQLKACFETAGMDVEFTGGYPGWQPDPHSDILEVLVKVYTERFGEAPGVSACHAGLECGIIGSNYPGMEMISFGPTIIGAHSPEERVNIPSVQKFWGYLLEILKEIPKK